MTELLRNNPSVVVHTAFSQAFAQGIVEIFQKNNEMRTIVVAEKDAQGQATMQVFKPTQRHAGE